MADLLVWVLMRASRSLLHRLLPTCSRAAGVIAFALLLGLARTDSARAAPAHPGWELTALSTPTNSYPSSAGAEERGPALMLVFTNVGAASTQGTLRIEDTLPAGVGVPAGRQASGSYQLGDPLEAKALACSVAGQVVTCVGSGPMVSGALGQIRIPLQTPATTQVLENEATISEGGAEAVRATNPINVSNLESGFGFAPGAAGMRFLATTSEGGAAVLAGSRPFQASIGIGFDTKQAPGGEFFATDGGVKDLRATLPKGFVVNPQATRRQCTESELENPGRHFTSCPPSSQVGSVTLRQSLVGLPTVASYPLYNMVSPFGSAAELGFPAVINGIYVHILGRLNGAGQYELAADSNDISAKTTLAGIEVNLWGNPSDPAHDSLREVCAASGSGDKEEEKLECSTEGSEGFLTMPSHCGPAGTLDVSIASWNHPASFLSGSTPTADANGEPVGTDGCNQLAFEPTTSSLTTTDLSDSPSGLQFDLHLPQASGAESRATANLRDVTVALPDGLAVNPAAGNGLDDCSEAEIELHGPNPATCPDASKLGTAEIVTPLLEQPLVGSVFLAKPFENEFHSLLALYLVVDQPRTGVVLKLPGEVRLDPVSGRLTTTFAENPELPFEDLRLSLFGGAQGMLTTPLACGTQTTTTTLTPWSSPEGADVRVADSFDIARPAGGSGACPSTEAEAPAAPAFSAGSFSPQAGAYSPFSLRISRADGTQRIAGIDAVLPKGLLGRVAGIPYCPEAAIAVARSREFAEGGRLEQAAPSCPAGSEVGTVQVTAGSGISPVPVDGRIYLAGPYKGAALSLVIVTPAVVGPFDLGAVVTRVALYVDPVTAQLRAISDPLPRILQGIPLDLRSIELNLGRPRFMVNPTSCEPAEVSGFALTQPGGAVPLSDHFQVGACRGLRFKPKLALSLFDAPPRRGGHPALRAVVTTPVGQANIGRAAVTLPRTEFLENAHIRDVCTRAQYAARACPPRSIYGRARAWTPLLGAPLEGPVYLRSSNHKLPDLVASLDGQIHLDLNGRIDSLGGRVRNTFEAVPDAPVTKFELVMSGRSKGLLVNNTDLCSAKPRASARFTGQNGKVSEASPRVRVKGCGGGKGKARKPGKRG